MAKKRKKGGPTKKASVKPAAAKPVDTAESKPAESKSADADDNRSDDKRDDIPTSDERTDDKPGVKRTDDKPMSRGAQRRQAARAGRARAAVTTPSPVLGPAEDPVFWFGFEVSWAKLVLARFAVFTLLAIDALMQIEHAPRYGAGGFNVAQLPLLDALAPGRVLYSVSQLVLGYLFVLVACGALTRYLLPIATAMYGWLYFSSHLDSYQHHYLVWLLLLLACFVPWQRPRAPDGTPFGVEPTTRVRSWALRLIYMQLALLYFWAAVSKMNAAWLDGRALSMQLSGVVRSLIDHTIGIKGAAVVVLLTELTLAATVWNKRTWFIAAPLGIALHAGILATSLDIGLFAWLMLGLYILVVPDRIWTWLADHPPVSMLRSLARSIASRFDGALQWLVWILAAVASLVLAGLSRFDHGLLVGLALLAEFIVVTIVLRKRISIAHVAIAQVLAFGVWTTVDRATKTASDYYRLWGGNAKRLGDPQTAEYAYRKMTEVAPDEGGGHYQLGKLLLERNADEEGIAELHMAQWTEPLKSRSYVAEARWLAAKGRKDEALEKAQMATLVEPDDQEAAALLDSLPK